jgi:hypothetical protein
MYHQFNSQQIYILLTVYLCFFVDLGTKSDTAITDWFFLQTTFNHLQFSGHYMYQQFNIQQFYVLPTQCILCFVWVGVQTVIISLYSINWLVSITEI